MRGQGQAHVVHLTKRTVQQPRQTRCTQEVVEVAEGLELELVQEE